MSDDLAALAADAYIYGFPLVFDLQMVSGKANMGMIAPAPFNSFSHASRLAGPDDRFVSINNDTIYSIAQVDVSSGPVLLRVPDAAGRYYVLQFVDAWTNNFAYAGRRTTGTAAGSFLLTPPGWQGVAPDGTAVIEFPTNLATIVGRWACDGPADLEAVRALQRGLTLEPFGAAARPWASRPRPLFLMSWPFSSGCGPGCEPSPRLPRTRTISGGSPPLACSTRPRRLPCPAELAQALTAGQEAAKQGMETALKTADLAPVVNGWRLTFHMFDYNVDHLGPGTIDDPAWKMPDRHTSYLARALAARGGLWGNHGYEAAYPMTYTDADGDQLDGRNRYTLTFGQDPPVDVFWSITMYDLPDFYLVANPIGRYSIGDRTPGLRRGADGSLTIAIQHEPPADTSNWLPAPAAPFRPLMRLYQPRAAILDGAYTIPPVTKAPS